MNLPEPYYSDPDGIILYHGDCRKIVPELLVNSIDLLVTDPPYGIAFQSNKRNEKFGPIVGDDGSLDVEDLIRDVLQGPLRRGRHIYVFGRLDVSQIPICGVIELIWDKQLLGMGNLELPWAKSHESIIFGVSELSKANREKGYGGVAARLRRGTVLRVQREQGAEIKFHPTAKPVLLLRQLIESSSIMGETVLDPFAGSGSTLIAARLEGRKAIGIEIEEKNCEVAAKRLMGRI